MIVGNRDPGDTAQWMKEDLHVWYKKKLAK
jgi:hypothetical protein